MKGDNVLLMIDLVWMEHNRHQFITTSLSLEEGTRYERERWRQVNTEVNADTKHVTGVFSHHKVCEVYYDAYTKIDKHNRGRQEVLDLEKKIKVKEWTSRVDMSIFGMCIVDI